MKIMYRELCSKHLKLLTELRSVIISFIFILILSQCYTLLSDGTSTGKSLSEKILVFNSLLAACFLIYFSSHTSPFPFWPKKLIYLVPGPLIILVTLFLGYISAAQWSPIDAFLPHIYAHWQMIFIVPIAEEVLFRLGLWNLLGTSSRASRVYLTSICFAILHYRGADWPVGPFILGVLSQLMLLRGGGLLSSILLHMACNATVAVFLTLDERWFDWLKVFYLS